MISKTKMNKYITVVVLILASFLIILTMCNNIINNVKKSMDDQIVDARKRDFEVVWGVLELIQQQANAQTEVIAKNIETQIYENFSDLDELKEKLDENDPVYTDRLYKLISDCVRNVHLNGIENNRNSMIVLEGYDTIIEDLLVDPDSRVDSVELKDSSSTSIYKYRDTTYNKSMFDTAMRKIKNHTDSSIICIEPYNYINSDTPHEMLREVNYANLERVYVNEGIHGLRNYQFLVPVYITDTGDIFGQADTVHGIKVDNHKFVVIQTFNLYDQIFQYKPDFGDDDYTSRIVERHTVILNSLYVLGIIVCALIAIIIIYFLSIYNALIMKDSQIASILNDMQDQQNNIP